MDGRPNRRNKAVFSTFIMVLWTGPEIRTDTNHGTHTRDALITTGNGRSPTWRPQTNLYKFR